MILGAWELYRGIDARAGNGRIIEQENGALKANAGWTVPRFCFYNRRHEGARQIRLSIVNQTSLPVYIGTINSEVVGARREVCHVEGK